MNMNEQKEEIKIRLKIVEDGGVNKDQSIIIGVTLGRKLD